MRTEETQQPMQQPRSSGSKGWIALIIVIVVLAVGGYFLLKTMPGLTGPTGSATSTAPLTSTKASEYQAVFLNNSQANVYFGKVTNNLNSQFIELEDIYYLQFQQQTLPAGSKTKQADQSLSLVKLGGELHGPTDKMYINRDQVLLIEDLREDSNLVQAIRSYKTSQK